MVSKFTSRRFWIDRTAQPRTASARDTGETSGELSAYRAFIDKHTAADRDAYADECIAAIERGETTWVVRSTDSDHGLVFDLISGRRQVGYVDYSEGIAEVTIRDEDETLTLAEVLDSDEPEANLMEAVRRLEAFAEAIGTQY